MPTIPKLYQPPRFIIAHTKFVTPHTHICNQLIIYKSCRDHANFHAKPIICNPGIILRIPHTPLYTYHSSCIHTQPKQTIQEQTNIQSQHCLAQHLAQVEGSRSGETVSPRRVPFRLGEGSTGTRKQRGSRLSEIPLSPGRVVCSLKTHPGRLSDHSLRKLWASLCTSRLGESSSPGRVYQCLPLFAPATRIHAPNRGSSQIQTFIAMHNLKEFSNHDNTS